MTKEQLEACEKLKQKLIQTKCVGFNDGFQAAQTPEMLILNPIVKGLVEALTYYEVGISVKVRLNPNVAKEALKPFKEGE